MKYYNLARFNIRPFIRSPFKTPFITIRPAGPSCHLLVMLVVGPKSQDELFLADMAAPLIEKQWDAGEAGPISWVNLYTSPQNSRKFLRKEGTISIHRKQLQEHLYICTCS